MKLTYVPLLQVQRDLYRIPRGRDRFRAYLRTMIDWDIEEMKLPLGSMNPMGKDHVPALLDKLLTLDADGAAARALAEAEHDLTDEPDEYRVALVVADDLKGGWTNRYATEFSHRFEGESLTRRGWLVGMLWTSESASAETAREEVLAAVYRAEAIRRHGVARTLREKMEQEGFAMARAGWTKPVLDPDDLKYTREVLAPYLHAQDKRTTIECLYGDAAGRTLGFAPCGLSARAGLALALHEAVAGGNRSLSGPISVSTPAARLRTVLRP